MITFVLYKRLHQAGFSEPSGWILQHPIPSAQNSHRLYDTHSVYYTEENGFHIV